MLKRHKILYSTTTNIRIGNILHYNNELASKTIMNFMSGHQTYLPLKI